MADDSSSTTPSVAPSGPASGAGGISLDALVSETAQAAAGNIELAASLGELDSSAPNHAGSNSVAGAPMPSTPPAPARAGSESGAAAVSGGAAVPNGAIAEPLASLDQVDRVLSIEDPGFVAGLAEIKEIGNESLSSALALEVGEYVTTSESSGDHSWSYVWRSRRHGLKAFVLTFVAWVRQHLRAAAVTLVQQIKAVVAAFTHLTSLSKVMVVGTIFLLVVLSMILRMVLFEPSERSLRLPKLEDGFLGEFGSLADHVYEYGEGAQMLNFQDPMLHPENVILIEHIVVNLHPSSSHSNPMALADFYIEAASRDAAIEVKEREVEVRDSMSRTLEQISYDELVTEAGKYKLKVILRKNLNDFMTTGRIRRLYFKSLVLKP